MKYIEDEKNANHFASNCIHIIKLASNYNDINIKQFLDSNLNENNLKDHSKDTTLKDHSSKDINLKEQFNSEKQFEDYIDEEDSAIMQNIVNDKSEAVTAWFMSNFRFFCILYLNEKLNDNFNLTCVSFIINIFFFFLIIKFK